MPGISTIDSQYYTYTRPEMRAFLPERRGRVLDIGCGQGLFLAEIEGAEEKWGVEPTGAADEAATRLHKVIRGTFDDAKPQLPPRYFDIVICNDVIEHMIDHDGFLTAVKDVIAPGGVLIGSVPNVRYYVNLFDVLIGKDWEYRDAGTMDRTHLRFFTGRSLRRALLRNGYRIDAFNGINSGINWKDRYISTRYKLFGAAAVIGSFGYFSDIQHLQFGFRVQPEPPSGSCELAPGHGR